MIPDKIKKLAFTDTFIEEFESQLPFYETQKEAYEHLESIHETEFGRRRFSDYESFRKTRKYHFEKRKKGKVFPSKHK